uniref:ARL14 effector protein-like n=1 Tax=Ciona intestinalis TaxID=7719 RepID=H2XJX3_CIOIN|nr:ARL14 effector protein-like isoform X1 [Ciona intestinalis]|eukprot:XP_002125376.1 ARL14 effector protein-like isoform X1 [Ciona intestinalis]
MSNEPVFENPKIKSLKFVNPGPALEDFNPEMSLRQERKLKRVLQNKKNKSAIYDNNGKLLSNGKDMCDCLNEQCPGCFYPCDSCGGTKCGKECRCSRKWYYDSVEVEGGQSRYFNVKTQYQK